MPSARDQRGELIGVVADVEEAILDRAHQVEVGAGRVEPRDDDAVETVLVAYEQDAGGFAVQVAGQQTARESRDHVREERAFADAFCADEQREIADRQATFPSPPRWAYARQVYAT